MLTPKRRYGQDSSVGTNENGRFLLRTCVLFQLTSSSPKSSTIHISAHPALNAMMLLLNAQTQGGLVPFTYSPPDAHPAVRALTHLATSVTRASILHCDDHPVIPLGMKLFTSSHMNALDPASPAFPLAVSTSEANSTARSRPPIIS